MRVLWIVAIAAICLPAAGMWAWYLHCFFFFHRWDTHRELSDVCKRCGAIRFK